HEPGWTVHIPDPRVGQLDLEPRAAGPLVLLNANLVGQIEPALRFDHVREHGEDVAVLAPQAELQVLLELLDVLFAHRSCPSMAGSPAGAPSSDPYPPGRS